MNDVEDHPRHTDGRTDKLTHEQTDGRADSQRLIFIEIDILHITVFFYSLSLLLRGPEDTVIRDGGVTV